MWSSHSLIGLSQCKLKYKQGNVILSIYIFIPQLTGKYPAQSNSQHSSWINPFSQLEACWLSSAKTPRSAQPRLCAAGDVQQKSSKHANWTWRIFWNLRFLYRGKRATFGLLIKFAWFSNAPKTLPHLWLLPQQLLQQQPCCCTVPQRHQFWQRNQQQSEDLHQPACKISTVWMRKKKLRNILQHIEQDLKYHKFDYLKGTFLRDLWVSETSWISAWVAVSRTTTHSSWIPS